MPTKTGTTPILDAGQESRPNRTSCTIECFSSCSWARGGCGGVGDWGREGGGGSWGREEARGRGGGGDGRLQEMKLVSRLADVNDPNLTFNLSNHCWRTPRSFQGGVLFGKKRGPGPGCMALF